MRGLDGKVIVVAGGGTNPGRPGLGAAGAVRFAEEGALVVVGDIGLAGAEQTVADITARGGTAVAHCFDASDESSVAGLIERALAEFGGVDGVHFNAMDMSAGTLGADSDHDLVTVPLAAWQRTLDVGLTGFLLTARHAIPPMLERGGGGIVATVSGAVYAGEPVRVAYAAAKTGVTAVVRHIASAYGRRGIRANALAPGSIPGQEGLADMRQPGLDRLMRMGRSKRYGQPDDIGNAAVFLLSDDGAWINGQTISVDGGTILGR